MRSIRLRVSRVDVYGSQIPGHVVEVDDVEADRLIAHGQAEEIEEPVGTVNKSKRRKPRRT